MGPLETSEWMLRNAIRDGRSATEVAAREEHVRLLRAEDEARAALQGYRALESGVRDTARDEELRVAVLSACVLATEAGRRVLIRAW